ncbi:fatty acid desaturase [Caulobacter sp. Root655]|uniref:acyl-CoA desaturase n=1 Tax=Caulobacter sp. Root655 TaxID=1736578 RepID=UPI0006F1E1C7|nr:acyl-CoA desaturase [Caulobacter sp. Root655]KRA66434.1 fatty acid desaturase [Caulobacter sp. Root655]
MTDHPAHDAPYAVHSIVPSPADDAVAGRVVWAPLTSIWQGVMLAGALAAPFFFSWSGLLVFVALTGATLLVGHSVGFHRRLIHGSFQSPLWLDHLMMYAGTLVGMSGPLAMIEGHDLRDWGQRQPDCHPYLSNRAGFWTDYAWNLHGRLVLASPPRVEIPPRIASDRFYRFLERTWMLQQLPVAIVLFALGGWSWLLWGVCARVCVSVTGHWFVGRLAHRTGPQRWLVEASGIQAHDVPWAAIPTMGEAWHNNHHAWPGSAKLGLYPGQADFGFAFIRLLEWLGLAWDVRTPETLPERDGLVGA